MDRKLAAILSADVKDYSRLMAEDEVATVRTLVAYRSLIESFVEQYRGRVVDTPGDNILAEFVSVTDAVQCAVQIQLALRGQNAEMPDHRKMEFRIGINLGDVIVDGKPIYGDGVNIAARLESLAPPGGICISGTVYDQVANKLALKYEYLGQQILKNISEPVRVYRAELEPEAAPLEMSDKPSIAVLPFVNMSDDPLQEHFSDGVTEDLITGLSRLSGLSVVASNTVFHYKGKAVKVKEVSRELGARYILEGSVRKAGNTVRITAQLIDGATGHHLWAERYDRELKDVFAVQDEITSKILAALKIKLTTEDEQRLRRSTVENATTKAGAPPLVGRESELSFLEDKLRLASQGKGSVVLLSGEPGIGKTRLVHEFQNIARREGFQWMEGRYDKAGSRSYHAWGEAIKTYLEQTDSSTLRRMAGPYWRQLAKLVPELKIDEEETAEAVGSDPEGERIRLFEAATQFFISISNDSPLVLFVDDLHWAPSAQLVYQLGRQVGSHPILLLGAYRKEELKENAELWRTFLAMNRERLFEPLQLEPFGAKEIEQLLCGSLGTTVSPELVELVYQKTEGNPFFVEEVIRLLWDRKAVVHTTGGWRIAESAAIETPDSVKAVIYERIERLGGHAEPVLRTASVIGREFSLRLLRKLVDLDEAALVEVLDRCEAAGLLLSRRTVGDELYSFVHDLTQESLYESIGPAQRRRHHLRVAQAIEETYSMKAETWYDGLAHHFLEGGDVAKALDYSLKAGEKSLRASAWPRAAHHFETALELFDEFPEDLTRKAQVLERLADLDRLFGRQGLRHTEQALALYTQLGNKKRAARMHRLAAAAWASGSAGAVNMEKALANYERAVDLVEDEADDVIKVSSYSSHAFGLARMLDLNRALQQAKRALEIAERLNDVDQLSTACTELAVVLAHRGEMTQAELYAERSWKNALQSRESFIKALAGTRPILWWPWRNNRDWLERWLARYAEYRKASHVQRYDLPIQGLTALLSALTGKPQEATEALRHAQEAISKRPYLQPYLMYFAGSAYAVLGDWQQASLLLSRAFESAQAGHSRSQIIETAIHYGQFLLASGSATKAEEVLTEAYDLALRNQSVVQEMNVVPLLCDLHVKTGRIASAEKHLSRGQELLLQLQLNRGLETGIYRAEAIVAGAKALWAEAEAAFKNALALQHTHGFPYYEALVLIEWGEMYFKRATPGDRERGSRLLEDALPIIKRCGANKDLERIQAALSSAQH